MGIFTKLVSIVSRKFRENYWLKFTLRKFGIESPLYPNGHYYSSIPNVKQALNNENLFKKEKQFPGIDLGLNEQLELLNIFKNIYPKIPFADNCEKPHLYYFDNPFFSYSDSIFLFCTISHFKPKTILEIGSGFSTACMLDTIRIQNLNTSIISIDPEMTRLNELLNRQPTNDIVIKRIPKKVQEVDQSEFQKLLAGDLLFIDSSHVSKVGSELNYLLFQILPQLKRGVIIHFHDVFHNFQYPIEWVQEGIYFNEQYLLRAFLQFNNAYKILLFNSFLEIEFRDWMLQHMPLCLKPHERYAFGRVKGQFIPQILGQSLYIIKS